MEGKSLQLMDKDELLEEISNNLLELISESEFILDFKLYLLSLPRGERSAFVNKVLEVVKNNNQSVGTFLISQKGTSLPPTVANWLKDFQEAVGDDFTEEEKEKYLNSDGFKKIDIGQRTVLQNLFEFYELLIFYQKNPDAIEKIVVKDKKGRIGILEKGEVYSLEEPEESLKEKDKKQIKPEFSKPESSKERLEEKESREEIKKEPQISSVPPKAVADSYMFPEDEEEIKAYKRNLPFSSEANDYKAVIRRIIEANNLSFSDANLEKRFELICSSFFKKIRDKEEIKDLLMRPTKTGGLEYSENLADKIISALEEAKKTPVQPETAKKTIPSPSQVLEKEVEEKIKISEPPEIEKKEVKEEEVAAEDVFYQKKSAQEYEIPKPIKPVMPEEEKREKREEEKLKPSEEKIRIFRPVSAAKPIVEDIKGKKKLLGPIDELREMSLNDFRRLGTDKISSIEKIYDKLNLLKEDSFAKYAEGIKAWRSSEVYKLYLDIGLESMSTQKSVNEVVEERKNKNLPYLTAEEFNSIANLNKKLRF